MHNFNLNEEQLKAANHLKGPALTLAVPGSGKTTLLLFRINNLVNNHGINSNKILSVTFSKASARDMSNRYKAVFRNNSTFEPSFSTIHSFCYNIISQYFSKKNIKYTLLESSKSFSKIGLLKNLYRDLYNVILSDDSLEKLQNEISYFKNMMFTASDYDSTRFSTENFINIYTKYESYKGSNDFIDFDDMLTITHKILKESDVTLNYFNNRYDYIQVDEAQDTSNIQFEILKLISNKKTNLFFVADDDQSIYSFRGANPNNLISFKEQFSNGIIYKLKHNYRSSEKICSLCNSFISQNTIRYEKTMVSNYNIKKENDIQIINFETVEERNEHFINTFKFIKNKTAVLFRNNLSSIGISYMLFKENVDFFIKDKATSFFNHFVVRDLKSFLELSIADNDISSFEKIYYKMDVYISKEFFEYVLINNRGRNTFTTLMESDFFSKKQLEQLNSIKLSFEKIKNSSPYEAIKIIESELGYIKFLDKISKKKNSSFKLYQKYLMELKTISRNTSTITEFILELDNFLTLLLNSSNNYNSLLQFSTFHSSKGLEYDDVFIIDTPSFSDDEDDIYTIEEERRLYYVAMSRAKNNLFIINTKFQDGRYEKKPDFLSFIEKNTNVNIIKHKSKSSQFTNFDDNVINHKIFGEGIILTKENDILKIQFSDKVRTLSYSLCKEKNFI